MSNDEYIGTVWRTYRKKLGSFVYVVTEDYGKVRPMVISGFDRENCASMGAAFSVCPKKGEGLAGWLNDEKIANSLEEYYQNLKTTN